MKTRLQLAVWCSVLGAATPAFAQSTNADALFRDGVRAMRAGDFATGCPMLEQSYRLDPMPGALFTLAECEASSGKAASALGRYRAFLNVLPGLPAARRETFEERRRIALEKVTTMSAVMPELTVDVAVSNVNGLVVRTNGALVDAASFGVTQKVDPGDYVVTAEAGDAKWERKVKLGERERARVVVPWPFPQSAASPAAPAAAPVDVAPGSRGGGVSRTWVYVAGGIGAAGLVTGAVAGLLALSNKSDLDANCPNHLCNAEGRDALSSGRAWSAISTVGFGVALAGFATAAGLYFFASPKHVESSATRGVRPSASIGPRGASVAVEGAF